MARTKKPRETNKAPWGVECGFLISAVSVADLPKADRPEVAFAGRSNVGKSSLLNALIGRAGLARTSNTPGRTQQLNYFALDDDCYLVDMPGYGYARASKKAVKSWTGLVKDYMRGRPNLVRLFLLIDARRGVLDSDREILKLLDEAAVSTQVVLTKADKVKAGEREIGVEKVRKALKPYTVVHPEILMTSSLKGLGIEDLRETVQDLCKT